MPDLDVGQATTGDIGNQLEDYSVPTASTEGATGLKETEFMNSNWNVQYGYYKNIPELKRAINSKAKWVTGLGYTTNEITEMLLMTIKGHGKENFGSIIKNQDIVRYIGGDSYAEIIRDGDQLVNIKSLDPSTIKVISNNKGRIIRYEQINKISKQTIHKFKPEQIFHLQRDRVADNILGTSVVDALTETILMYNESLADMKILQHRHVVPVRVLEVDTENTTKIARIRTEYQDVIKNRDLIIVPMGTVKPTIDAVAPNETLNPLAWQKSLVKKFYQVVGTPQIIVGGSEEITEATAKILLLVWIQEYRTGQLYLQEEILSQLNLEIEFILPASIQNELITGEDKAETPQATTKEDTAVTNTGVKTNG